LYGGGCPAFSCACPEWVSVPAVVPDGVLWRVVQWRNPVFAGCTVLAADDGFRWFPRRRFGAGGYHDGSLWRVF
jgi:hypothetical protein